MADSGDFIFKRTPKGTLAFVGDFDGYYRNDADPWGQSGQQSSMKDYYKRSRERTFRLLDTTDTRNLLLVGCGIGYTMNNYRQKNFIRVVGIDVSGEAINRAKKQFPEFDYHKADIMDGVTFDKLGTDRFDTVIFEQILWYILEGIDNALGNARRLLTKGGNLIISNAFDREQQYGTEIIDGYPGAVQYFYNAAHLTLKKCCYYDDDFRHTDAHFLLECY